MASKSIPFVGEVYTGDEPAVMKVAKITYGVSSGSPDVETSATSDAAADDELFSLPDNCIIHDVGWKVTETFTDSFAGTLGTSTDPDGFAAAADFGATDTADSVINWMRGLGVAALKGATFPTSDTTLPAFAATGFVTASATDSIRVASGAITPTAGKADIYVVYSMAENIS